MRSSAKIAPRYASTSLRRKLANILPFLISLRKCGNMILSKIEIFSVSCYRGDMRSSAKIALAYALTSLRRKLEKQYLYGGVYVIA